MNGLISLCWSSPPDRNAGEASCPKGKPPRQQGPMWHCSQPSTWCKDLLARRPVIAQRGRLVQHPFLNDVIPTPIIL